MILILDIDGTLADAAHRSHHVDKANPDWDSFLLPELVILDTVVQDSQRGVRLLSAIADKVIFLTGRNERLRACTTKWLKTHFGVDCTKDNLIMRPIDNMEKPTEFKGKALQTLKDYYVELSEFGVMPKFMAIDDDPFMMKIYRGLGIIALHAPECWKTLFPDFDHLTNETTWRK